MFFNFLKKNRNIATFEKVSFDQYKKDWENLYGDIVTSDELLHEIYDHIQLPSRSTDGSAGYDFYAPFTFGLSEGDSIVIPTGIRSDMNIDWFMMAAPRSGQGFKFKLVLANTLGIIDSDYYGADNEGHIMIKLVYEGMRSKITPAKIDYVEDTDAANGEEVFKLTACGYNTEVKEELPTLTVKEGQAFCQGIFVKYGTVFGDYTKNKKRKGGIGSTDKR